MSKGTTSFGPRNDKTHTLCIRCGHRAFHCQKKRCAQCGYPDAKMRKYNWATKAHRRHTTGTGRCRYLKTVKQHFKMGFKHAEFPKPVKAAKTEKAAN